MKPTLVILAAGIGSRYGGLKQIDAIGPGGEAIVDYSVYDALRAGFGKIVLVIRKSIEKEVRAFFEPKLKGRVALEFVYQELDMLPRDVQVRVKREKPWGTAHAVLCARDAVHEPFAVINGDDFYGPSSYKLLSEFLTVDTDPDLYAMVGYRLDRTLSPHGSVARGVCNISDDGYLRDVTEYTKIYAENGTIFCDLPDGTKKLFSGKEVVSMNFWGFKPNVFDRFERIFKEFIRKNGDDPKAEFFIPIPLSEMIRSGEIRLRVIEGNENWFGVTYKEDKPAVIDRVQSLIEKGVYPEKLWE